MIRERNPSRNSFFTVAQQDGRWRFVTPGGEPFFSIGMNHIDPATLLNGDYGNIWNERFYNSMREWLENRVASDLKAWGFNTVGWVQEVVVRGGRESTLHRHSRNFTYEEYQWLGLPYCHMLPFSNLHQWEVESRYPDVFSPEFEEWCDYVAQSECARMRDDPKLIGYFYSDCPTWTHDSVPHPACKRSWFDPSQPKGRKALAKTARRYYRTLHDAVRRYDPQHLILGDRYEAGAPISDEVLEAARPCVDMISLQFFDEPNAIRAGMERLHQKTGLPVLLADACVPRPEDPGAPDRYREMMRLLLEIPCCVGWHYCGAYLKNRVRGRGLRREGDAENREMVSMMAEVNKRTVVARQGKFFNAE